MAKRKKCYLSGPMAGIERWVMEAAFEEAEKVVRELKVEPISPLRNGLAADSSWEQHMKADVKLLMECDMIYMLDGWEKSRGARLEFNLAAELGIKNITFMPLDEFIQYRDGFLTE